MNLPIYQHITIRTVQIEEVQKLLHKEINFKHPVVFNLKILDLNQQREMIGYIENYFLINNLSFKFPYPVYLLISHASSISQMPSVRSPEQLPRFYSQKESKMNVKEGHLLSKNRLLQQEIFNADSQAIDAEIQNYASFHREIYELEQERLFYRALLNKLDKKKKHG